MLQRACKPRPVSRLAKVWSRPHASSAPAETGSSVSAVIQRGHGASAIVMDNRSQRVTKGSIRQRHWRMTVMRRKMHIADRVCRSQMDMRLKTLWPERWKRPKHPMR